MIVEIVYWAAVAAILVCACHGFVTLALLLRLDRGGRSGGRNRVGGWAESCQYTAGCYMLRINEWGFRWLDNLVKVFLFQYD